MVVAMSLVDFAAVAIPLLMVAALLLSALGYRWSKNDRERQTQQQAEAACKTWLHVWDPTGLICERCGLDVRKQKG